MWKLLLLVATLSLLCATSFAAAAKKGAKPKTKAFKHPLTDMPRSAKEVETSHFFPVHSDNKMPIGDAVTALCHFSNDGSTVYNVTAIMGSLNSPVDFRHYFQNYSYKPYGVIVKAGEEISFKYAFQIHTELEPIDYQLSITVFYESEKGSFSTTFFNQTVELYYPSNDFDLETVMSVLGAVLFTALIILVTVFSCFPEVKIPLVSEFFNQVGQLEKNNIRTLSTKEDPDDDWLTDQPVPQGNKTGKKTN